jgi:hypothetical protein
MYRFRVGSFFLSCVFLLSSHSLKAQDEVAFFGAKP